LDYPLPYVRWTEKRNIESFLELVSDGRVNVDRLVTHRFSIDEAERAYHLISDQTNEPYLGVLLNYDPNRDVERRVELKSVQTSTGDKSISVGVIGAGGYVPAMLLPHFKTEGVNFHSIATATGISANDVGRRFGFACAVSSGDEVINDKAVNLVLIGTPNYQHAELTRKALELGKNVFVEKPLALNDEQLKGVVEAATSASGQLMVGFNRRFSPLGKQAKEFFEGRTTPLTVLYRVNAGRIPKTHWMQNAEEGGGRIIGEVCHFVDLMQFLAGAPPVSVFAESVSAKSDQIVDDDSVVVALKFADGSNGTIAYLSEGDKALPKERVEIFGGSRAFVLDDFSQATKYREGREETVKLRAQDKGQKEQVRVVCASLRSGAPAPIPLNELVSTTRTTFAILESLRTRERVEIV
jgi:polar amino acid transport system substrate-binding protein